VARQAGQKEEEVIPVFFGCGLIVIAVVITLAVIFETDMNDRHPHP
jgi:hypothetical protein